MVDDLDDAAAVTSAVVFFGFLDTQQHAVADAGGLAGPRLARSVDADLRRRPVRVFVPFVGRGDQLAVAVARGDVGEHGRGQRAGMVQLLAAFLDRAFVGEFAQHALEFGAHGVLQAEGAGDLAGADLAGLLADEGENVSLGGKGGCFFVLLVQNRFSCAKKARLKMNVMIESKLRQLLGGGGLDTPHRLGVGGNGCFFRFSRGRFLRLGRR